ncbi:MAG TPA: mechanosensitive ion channel family protein [Candidatus Binatia bacterium]|jgi:MscS family membrane protein|nr:mechanosensitive ion channel family protein [Candidatus Binatia bacterium]
MRDWLSLVMKLKFDTCFRGFLVFLVATLAFGLWAGAQTVTNKPAATNQPSALVKTVERFETAEHPLTFGLDRVEFLHQTTFLGEPLWKYLASAIYILLAFYTAKFIDFVTRIWLKKLSSKTDTKLDDLMLGLLRGPIKAVVFVVLLNIGLNIFDWSPTAKIYLSKALILVVAASLTYLALKVLDLLLGLWKRRVAHEANRRFNDQLFAFLRKTLIAFVLVVAVLVTAQNMGMNITAAITSLSIGGLAVGLAAQDTLANLFGAVAILTDRPFHVGDHIKLDKDGAEGTVEVVGLRSTRLRNPEGQLVSVPNKNVGNATITNISERPGIKTVMNLALVRTLPPAKIKRALALLEEIYRHHPLTQDVWISFNQFSGANINILVMHWSKPTEYKKYLEAMQEMNLPVKERFDAEEIGFA